jgi:hypothetical protein
MFADAHGQNFPYAPNLTYEYNIAVIEDVGILSARE